MTSGLKNGDVHKGMNAYMGYANVGESILICGADYPIRFAFDLLLLGFGV